MTDEDCSANCQRSDEQVQGEAGYEGKAGNVAISSGEPSYGWVPGEEP